MNSQSKIFKMIRSNYYPMLKREIPSTRYVGSKQKIVNWVWDNIQDLDFNSFLDLFGGTGIVGYVAKLHGKKVPQSNFWQYCSIGISNKCVSYVEIESQGAVNWLKAELAQLLEYVALISNSCGLC